jgi:hypothetical protein
MGPSGDEALDIASWEKSRVCTLLGHMQVDNIPANVRLLPRRPIWESHGGKAVPTVRNIDDGAYGEQNGTVGLTSVHRPCTVDRLVSRGREVSSRFPSDMLSGFTTDFGGAYRQVPSDPNQSHLFGITMWDPLQKQIVVGLAVAQIFGSRSAPLNFSRYPDWCKHVCMALLRGVFDQCIDDLICIERLSTTSSARSSWLCFANLCGWDIPLAKSPEPAQLFRALGVFVDLRPLPFGAALISACEQRLANIEHILMSILKNKHISPSLSASVAGKLQFTTSSFAGRFGKAMIRCFNRRAHETGRFNLNPQISSTCDWWIRGLKVAPSRPIPWRIEERDLVISYSDGEGSDAGVGVAIWSKRLSQPEGGLIDVPLQIRKLWARQRLAASGDLYDIQEIEGIGPLLVLTTWPDILANSVWIHFIDNNGALACLVKGNSSCLGTDTIVGMTWHSISKLNTLPWFDRVDTKSNPVDGLSRKKLDGPWKIVPLRFPSASLKFELRRAQRFHCQESLAKL